MATPESDSFVRSFARGLAVIEAMGQGSGENTVASIAAGTGLPRTVARRILMTLTELGFTRTDGKTFRLTPKILNLGMTYLTSLPFWGLAQNVLENLCAEVKESVALSVFDEGSVVFLLRIPSRNVMSLRLGVGSRLPAHVTSPGRVLLAYQDEASQARYFEKMDLKSYTAATLATAPEITQKLQEVKQLGYAWVDGELDMSICGLSVPVRNEEGLVVAALNVNLMSGDATKAAAVKRYLKPLRASAEQLRAMAPQFLTSVGQTSM